MIVLDVLFFLLPDILFFITFILVSTQVVKDPLEILFILSPRFVITVMSHELQNQLLTFDVASLYTNVAINEAINDYTEFLYSRKYPKAPILKLKTLTVLWTCNVLLLSHEGYYFKPDISIEDCHY